MQEEDRGLMLELTPDVYVRVQESEKKLGKDRFFRVVRARITLALETIEERIEACQTE